MRTENKISYLNSQILPMSNPFKNIQGETAWRAPSNIALVKYWGKYGISVAQKCIYQFYTK
jgi:mevalonate pyrophosphate decarboxylase